MRNVLHSAVLATGLSLALAFSAVADPLSDCRQASGRGARLAACSAAIDSTEYDPAQKAIAYRQRGSLRLDAGALDMAIADLSEAVRLAPSDAQAYVLRAQARTGKNDLEAALADFDAAIKLGPNSAAYNGRGHLHMVRGSTAAAIADFSQAIALNPRSAVIRNNLGLAHRKTGAIDRAIAEYTEAINLNPIYALAYNNRGYAYEAKGNKDLAAADFKRALLIDSGLIGAKDGLARLGRTEALAEVSAKLISDGKALVEKFCSGCHAVGSTGDSANRKAPPFRTIRDRHPVQALREPLTRGIAAPHDEMPKFALPASEVDKIVAYVNNLSQGR